MSPIDTPRLASLITPIHSDVNYPLRAAVVREVCNATGWSIATPAYDPQAPIFDATKAKAMLASVELVIADLSLARPSCYFELGFAEALNKRVRLIAQQGAEIHQSSHRHQVVFYNGLSGFRTALTRVLIEDL